MTRLSFIWKPKPVPPGCAQGKVIPERTSSFLSRITFSWLNPLLWAGYTRPLELGDLWTLPPDYTATQLASLFESSFYSRCPPSSRPPHLRNLPDYKHQDSSLLRTLHRAFLKRWWAAAVLKLMADTLITTTPLVNQVLLEWLVSAYIYHRLPADLIEAAGGFSEPPQGIGYGIGLAFALFCMRQLSILLDQTYTQITMTLGMQMRTGMVAMVHRKALRLSGKSRQTHTIGQVITLISKDGETYEQFGAFAHLTWIAPIQIVVGMGLFIKTLGYSALAGFGIIVAGMPVFAILVGILYAERKKGTIWTDKRIRCTSEVIQGIRLVKFFGWEKFYETRIASMREHELRAIRNFAVIVAALTSIFTFLPIGAAILSFITYSLTDHDLSVPVIFTALQFIGVLTLPMIMFPLVLSALAQFHVSLQRTQKFLLAEEMERPYEIDEGMEDAIVVEGGQFVWEVVEGDENEGKEGKEEEKGQEKAATNKESKPSLFSSWFKKKQEEAVEVDETTETKEKSSTEEQGQDEPFCISDLSLQVPRGAFHAIVGGIGSGKSSLLEALVGEMRKTGGKVQFHGDIAYVPQKAWIRNQSLRDNILFGQPYNEKRYNEVVHACCLEPDIAILPQGDLTEIGEKGINLSGGQRARVSLARAAYSDCPIVLLDDPLASVDAHVGQFLLDHCFLTGPLSNRTRLLVTHALHVLPFTDHVYMVEQGVIVEQGSYEHLSSQSPQFSRLIRQFGRQDDSDLDSDSIGEKVGADGNDSHTLVTSRHPGGSHHHQRQHTGGGVVSVGDTDAEALMQAEERITGAVEWSVYKRWFEKSGGIAWAPVLLLLLILNQGAQVLVSLTLGWWTSDVFHGFQQGHYMALYAGLGGAMTFFAFLATSALMLLNLVSSRRLFSEALHGLLASPISYFDTTPTGRILSRLSKDQDTIDTEISMTSYQFLTSLSGVFGTIALVAYVFPYLTLIFIPLGILYWIVSIFYRATSVETKRLDSILRSSLYAAVSESLTGLSTIRAFGRMSSSVQDADKGQNQQNQAYFSTFSIQRWLSVRLDTFGNILVLGIGLFAAGFRTSVDPSRIGVVLSYTLQITQILSSMITMMAQMEQGFNCVERLLVYGDLEPEEERLQRGGGIVKDNDRKSQDDSPLPSPKGGDEANAVVGSTVIFENVEMAYRIGLPLVLKGVSFQLRPGEKVGVVGRTGAGKSSLIQALFRIVELSAGKITIDGVDTSTISLHELRRSIALVPQESPLFYGDIRQNIDPEGQSTDEELLGILHRTGLLPPPDNKGHQQASETTVAAESKFGLDCLVGDEGVNYSAGEKQLIALCRALVKKTKVIVLDEATSSVDAETDAKIQHTIRTEFNDRTLLCIAHRIGTIVRYDRIIVMEEGRVAEFDTVLNLMDMKEGRFAKLCEDAGLTREDVVRMREGGEKASEPPREA